ncbi:MAG: type VI secretion system baseplate subunit TssF [Saccharospirillum sp.]|nr:type VI secretion system baseplate subunit TssF [Saccharospirillum sp.]
MKEYFEAEMRQLLESAQDFAEAYPEQARMLNLNAVKDRDPYVERLLEGMAYLTAQVQKRIDDSVPELSEALLNQLHPALCRDYPSHCVVQFDPGAYPKGTLDMPAQRILKAVKGHETDDESPTCEFRTSTAVRVHPLRLVQVQSEETNDGGTHLALRFERPADLEWADLDLAQFPLFLHGDWGLVYSLFELLTRGDTQAQLYQGGHRQPVALSTGDWAEQPGVLPETGQEHAAFSLLHDYFCARERFLFVSVQGLRLDQLDPEKTAFDLHIHSQVALPAGHQLTARNLQMNCAQAVNLFPAEAEPIKHRHQQASRVLWVENAHRGSAEVYRITGVQGRDLVSGEVRRYYPLHAMRYRDDSDATYCEQSRRVGADQRQVQLVVDQGSHIREESLSIDVLASNEQLPRRLFGIGEFSGDPTQLPDGLAVTNLTRPSRMQSPPALHDHQWQLVSLMSLTLSALDNADKLQQVLGLFDWSDQLDNRQRIRAISSLAQALQHRIEGGALCQIVTMTLEIDERGFSSRSDLFLMGTVLHQFFGALASVSDFVETRVVALPSYKEWTWKACTGQKAVL